MNWTTRLSLSVLCVAGLVRCGTAQQFGVGISQPALAFQQGIMTTLAGNGTSGSTGDGGPAASAELTTGLRGIAGDTAGDVFFVDTTNHTVRVVYGGGASAAALITAENPTVTAPVAGNIYVVAGKEGSSGVPANGTLATNGAITPGAGLSIDAYGDVYFNDTSTNKVWIIYGGGTGTTGTNLIKLEANVASPVLGYIYAIAGNSSTSGYAGSGVLATSAGVEFSGINDMKFDAAGDMFIVDQGNYVIREVSASNGFVTTVVGTPGVAGTSTTLGNSGPATTATLSQPYGIAIDASGDMYIADKGSVNQIRMVYMGGTNAGALIKLENSTTVTTPTTGYIYLIAGSGAKGYPYGGLGTASSLSAPTMVALDAGGNIYVADNTTNLIDQINILTGILLPIAGNDTKTYTGDGGLATSAGLQGIRCVAVDPAGRIYITDATNLRVREVSSGIVIFVGEPVGQTSAPQGLTIENTGGAALTFTGPPVIGGTNASAFAVDYVSANTCSTANTPMPITLQPGQSCVQEITYAPTTSGTSAATITYTTNGVLTTQTAVLQGQLTPATTGLAASTTATYPGQTVTLTATVTGVGTLVPTGTLSFYQAGVTAPLQTVTLANGATTAMYTTAALSSGTYSYTVVYSGDTNYAGSTSNIVVVSVDSFSVSASSTTLSVVPGQTAQTTLTITGQGPASQLLSLSCVAPTGILGCSFNPSAVTLTSNGTAQVVVTVAAVATTGQIKTHRSYELAWLPLSALLIVGLGTRRKSRLALLVALFCLLPLSLVTGCAENNIGKAVQPSTQTVALLISGPGANPQTQAVVLTVNIQ
jgi:hypothetical protein